MVGGKLRVLNSLPSKLAKRAKVHQQQLEACSRIFLPAVSKDLLKEAGKESPARPNVCGNAHALHHGTCHAFCHVRIKSNQIDLAMGQMLWVENLHLGTAS